MRILGITGYSGSGKTTLLEQLLPWLRGQGLSVSVIKQTHHDVDLDQPGKDSWRHREAGAQEVMLVSDRRWALLAELHERPRPPLAELLAHFSEVDLVLLEGFKNESIDMIEVHRPALGKPLLQPANPYIVAVATDVAELASDVAVLDINNIPQIGQFVMEVAKQV